MPEDIALTDAGAERRAEARSAPETYHSAEFRIDATGCLFQSRIWNVSARGMCLLARADSEVLENLEIGKQMEVKYYPQDPSRPPETRRTRIAHVTRESEGKFKNHVLIGLQIIAATEAT